MPGRGGRARAGILLAMGTEAGVGRRRLLLFAAATLCKWPESRGEPGRRAGGRSEAPARPSRGGAGFGARPRPRPCPLPWHPRVRTRAPPARAPRAAGPAHGADAGGPSPRTWGGSPRPGAARVRRSRQEPCARRRFPGLLAAAPAGAPESLMEGRGRLSLAVAGEVSLLPRNLGGGGCPGKRVRVQSLKKYN